MLKIPTRDEWYSTIDWYPRENKMKRTFHSPLVFSLAQRWARWTNNLIFPYELPQTRDERLEAELTEYEALKYTGVVLPVDDEQSNDKVLVYPYAHSRFQGIDVLTDLVKLSAHDRAEIERAGFHSLAKIHENGHVHGNAHLKNFLYLQDKGWFWIDLGTKINETCEEELLIANDYLTFTLSLGEHIHDSEKQNNFYRHIYSGTMPRNIHDQHLPSLRRLLEMHLDHPLKALISRRVSSTHLTELYKGLNHRHMHS
ncbi:MAG TPA: hypothetical protein VJJ79_00755 [Candidatus Nanoarchaeia archaeon]|nr:hypothetical protein [Candidatus Nanoarchaeia archaeon]